MEPIRIIDIKESVFADNDKEANRVRERLKQEGTFLLNLMSSPGAGKTSCLLRTIERLSGEMRIGVLEADIDSVVDAEAIAATGTQVVQLHTGGLCHLDAGMTEQGLDEIGAAGFDLVVLENVGNLVCPAEFDTGATKNAMILSVPEGDDKPLKYPLMFTIVQAVLINKIDCLPYFDFDVAAVKQRVLRLNPDCEFFEVSAKTGEGFERWADWIRRNVKTWNSSVDRPRTTG
jgi:hydrogenase nickel incorporation protein HypB